jgi:membrane fusion protein, multidrug efflux system
MSNEQQNAPSAAPASASTPAAALGNPRRKKALTILAGVVVVAGLGWGA